MGEALQRAAGREACRALGADVAREVAGGPMSPLVSMRVARFRGQLHGVYGRVGSVCNLLVRGPAFTFTPGGERDGVLEIAHGEPTPDAVYALWEGALLHTNRLCGVEGGVGRSRLGERGHSGHVDVSW